MEARTRDQPKRWVEGREDEDAGEEDEYERDDDLLRRFLFGGRPNLHAPLGAI